MTETFQDRVTLTVENGVADVRLNRPDKLNALDPAMFAGIIEAIEYIWQRPEIRCVVLSGEGRAFCAGLDIASMGTSHDLMERTHCLANDFQQVAWGWRDLNVPVISAIHGVAFGGGFQIMSGADIIIAAPATRMAIMEIKWGIVPDMAGFALWKGRVSDDHIRELSYTAREFDSAEARETGFVTHIADDPKAKAMDLARSIADRNPHAVRAVKRLANAMADGRADEILRRESKEQAALLGTKNQIEAISANLGKRTATFEDD